MILTVLDGTVAPERTNGLRDAYANLTNRPRPNGLVRSDLLQSGSDASHWRLQTLWASREALDHMRSQGTPGGVLVFRAAGAEPTLTIFDVVSQLDRD